MARKRRATSPIQSFEDEEEYFNDETSSNGSTNHHPPIQRNAANARERARMRVLSSAFCRLKTKLPNIPADTKLSKLDTLRLAKIYIQDLSSLLNGEQQQQQQQYHKGTMNTSCMQHQHNMTWPFAFQHITSNYRPPVSTNHNFTEPWNHHEKMQTDYYGHDHVNDSSQQNQNVHHGIYDSNGQLIR